MELIGDVRAKKLTMELTEEEFAAVQFTGYPAVRNVIQKFLTDRIQTMRSSEIQGISDWIKSLSKEEQERLKEYVRNSRAIE